MTKHSARAWFWRLYVGFFTAFSIAVCWTVWSSLAPSVHKPHSVVSDLTRLPTPTRYACGYHQADGQQMEICETVYTEPYGAPTRVKVDTPPKTWAITSYYYNSVCNPGPAQ